MKTSAIRDRLYDYIRVADDKKLKAIYMMLEDDIDGTLAWWENDGLIKELEAEYKDWKDGKVKGYTIQEVRSSIDQLRVKRNNK